ncbi:NAD(P)-binding domain-containing protein [Tabrizicola sp.]|uniref:NADPH-dependent F420 reductase n=1 Tax=Tabrizicola sp. TaxID=2005166 RepID=UPI00286D4452|nr:NAD(P)-binding domain-containing protein [Tabrizicola sp.]
MRIGIIGGGGVAQTLGTALIAKGHDVVIGIRQPSSAELAKDRSNARPLAEWVATTGGKVATFSDAARHGEVLINATSGQHSLEALHAAGAAHLAGKVLIDVANPLDFSKGMPPFVLAEFSGPTSLGEQVQAAFPQARVVKAFNTIAAAVMVTPSLVAGEHDLFIAGNDAQAKAVVTEIAKAFGWTGVVDLGDIVGARASESILPVWVRLWMTGGSPILNLKVARAA